MIVFLEEAAGGDYYYDDYNYNYEDYNYEGGWVWLHSFHYKSRNRNPCPVIFSSGIFME